MAFITPLLSNALNCFFIRKCCEKIHTVSACLLLLLQSVYSSRQNSSFKPHSAALWCLT